MGLAAHCANDTIGCLPPGWIGWWTGGNNVGPWKLPGTNPPAGDITYFFCLMPFLEQNALYRNSAGSGVPSVLSNSSGLLVTTYVLQIMFAPGDWTSSSHRRTNVPGGDQWMGTTWGLSSYAWNHQVVGVAGTSIGFWDANNMNGQTRIQNISDGTSNTILHTEKMQVCNQGGTPWAVGPWASDSKWQNWIAGTLPPAMFQDNPTASNCDTTRAQSFTAGGIHVGLADGSVRCVASGVSVNTWQTALIPNDSKTLGSDWDAQ